MKIEKLKDLPKGQIGDFYFKLLRMPMESFDQADLPDPDPSIDKILEVTHKDGLQLGYVILRDDHTIEVINIASGEHLKLTLGLSKPSEEQHLEHLRLVAFFESDEALKAIGHINLHLDSKDYIGAYGRFQVLEQRFHVLGGVISTAMRYQYNWPLPSAESEPKQQSK